MPGRKQIFRFVLLLLPLVCIALTAGQVLLYADDYYYGMFLRDGVGEFIEQNVEHYQTFNGRVLVHLLAQLIIPEGADFFGLLAATVLFFLFRSGERLSDGTGLQETALSLALCLLIPVTVLRESLFWRSAACNYLYPALLLMLSVYFLKKGQASERLPLQYLFIFFLCGATTEQCGITMALVLLSVIVYPQGHKRLDVFCKAFLPCLLGILTVMASPATQARAALENSTETISFWEKLLSRCVTFSDMLLSWEGAGLFCLLLALAMIFFIQDKKNHFRLISAGWFVLLRIFLALPEPPVWLSVPILLASLTYASGVILYLLKNKALYYHGLLLAAAYGTLLVMLGTDSMAPRTLLPFILLTIAVIARLMLAGVKNRAELLALAALAGVVCFAPTLTGYIHNGMLDRENLSRLENRSLHYCLDYDETYRHTMMQDDGYFMDMFRKYYKLEPDRKIQFYSKSAPALRVDGKLLSYPAMKSGNDLYLPFSLVFSAMGAEQRFDGTKAYFKCDDTTYVFDFVSHDVTYVENGVAKKIHFRGKTLLGLYTGLEIRRACRAFGWQMKTYDAYIEISEKTEPAEGEEQRILPGRRAERIKPGRRENPAPRRAVPGRHEEENPRPTPGRHEEENPRPTPGRRPKVSQRVKPGRREPIKPSTTPESQRIKPGRRSESELTPPEAAAVGE